MQLIANASNGFAQQTFQVVVSCPEPAVNPTGCGSGAVGAAPVLLLALLGLARRRRFA